MTNVHFRLILLVEVFRYVQQENIIMEMSRSKQNKKLI